MLAAFAPAGIISATPRDLAKLEHVNEMLESIHARDAIPHSVIEQAEGVVLITNVVKAGFVASSRQGVGTLSVRLVDGSWSHPLFVQLENIPVDVVAGPQEAAVVLIFRTERSALSIIDGPVVIGFDVSSAPGLVADAEDVDNKLSFSRAEVGVYLRVREKWSGLDLEGAVLRLLSDRNRSIYDDDSARRILADRAGEPPPEAQALRATFGRHWP